MTSTLRNLDQQKTPQAFDGDRQKLADSVEKVGLPKRPDH
ncbi:hypothetical protein C4K07_4860 [Pseudomonas chlororaphis subsp. aureofaciens]|uniref:Uncharacterized protein n=1 Tax=Pseudomonas chlororaphis subsp. aureofaciens TaxID=587851 RepID=A0AAD1E7Y0_9PSED|nr:hypothetical protein C4K07_4860 [Pseudomonas chlororaphis subsp. aureofaciens]